MQLTTLFAVPLGATRVSDCSRLNSELTKVFLEAEKDPGKYANKQRNSVALEEVFESRFDLFSWQHPSIAELRELMMRNLYQFVASLSRMPNELAGRLQVRADSWFHITRSGGYFTAHNHPNASWSVVYCVAGGDDDGSRKENGVLRFLDYKASSSMFLDPANSALPEPFSVGNRVYKLAAGDLIIFPSYLLHEVSPYFGENPRITVAVNAWFIDPANLYPGSA